MEALHPQSFPPPVTPWQDLFLVPQIVPELLARSLRAFPAETNSPRTHRRPFDTACCYGQLGFPRNGPDHHCRSVAVPSGGGFGTGRGSSLFLALAGWYWSQWGGKEGCVYEPSLNTEE